MRERVVIYGAGVLGKRIAEDVSDKASVIAFLDGDEKKQTTAINGGFQL